MISGMWGFAFSLVVHDNKKAFARCLLVLISGVQFKTRDDFDGWTNNWTMDHGRAMCRGHVLI